ncbi:transient receptor potential cation channel subfamily V member 5-like [Physella acuta]|uniref:transient receptor potential cation channel subfamily V member 5-like n=1 Tax=Physella acuta TaxID=109671 RepID=UPI0027DB6B07|nr:transient receptor potential cation channel subfamily V member 5-like [Physella acuta]
MGNTSVVASGVKNQGDTDARKLYQFVNLKGGGELVELTKVARWTKNFTELDERIKRDVEPFLYNGGKGKNIPVLDLVKMRNKDRQKSGIKASKSKQKSAQDQATIDNIMQMDDILYKQGGDHKSRFQCWDIEKRGTVGETILHLCLLNSTQAHADLAKRLLMFYPKMINDIYIGEEYYGENLLHIAIVNEDPAMVKFLLDKGVDFEARVCGNFFTPDDQKGSRTDSLDHEWVNVCKETNYEGNVYWGDYPLSFAACLNQEECVRLLLAKGANPNLQDLNGNTVMHMLVIYDNIPMFDLLYSQGGRLDIKNRQNLTPLTLAAKLAKRDMFEHILEMVREVYWLFCNVTSAGYPLTDVDTISRTGEINMDSALHLIVKGNLEGHLDMMDGVIVKLLQEKWKTFVSFRFYRRFFLFICYFICFVTAFALRPGVDLCSKPNQNVTLSYCQANQTANPCYLLMPYRTEDIVRMVLEVVVLISAVIYIFLALKEIYHQGFKVFFSTLTGAPAKTLFLMSCIFVVLMLPGRATCAHQFEDVVGVLAVLCTSPYFLFFCRGFRIVGPSVVMIYNMIRKDLLQFFIIYVVFIVGFSQAMYIIFMRDNQDPFNNAIDSIMGMVVMSLGQFGDYYDLFGRSRFTNFAKVIFVVYMILVTLLLVNMLIAMMGRTYELVTNTQKEWFRQWANIVLAVEQTVTTESRRLQMIKYSVPFGDKERALMIRWQQTEKEREEQKTIRNRNKISQKAMASQKARERRSSFRKMPNREISYASAKTGLVNI